MRLKIVCLAAAVLLPGWAAVAQNDTLSTSHTVGKEQMNKGLVTSGLGALQGQAAGVTVSGANQSAMLSAVRVRGTTSLTGGNDPLVVIDGVMSDLATLSSLYPGDIESFTVLKDASETAPYGSRGASGVIQVLTTRGHGGDFSISYDGTAGAEAVYRNMEMLSADGFRTWNKNHGYPFKDDGFDSDMVSSILRTGFVQNHHIAFGGGSENSHYRASVGVLDHRAVIKKQNIQNYSVKLDVGQKAFGFLQLDLGLFGSLQNEDAIHDMQKLFYSAAAFNPTIRAGAEPDGSYVQIPTSSQINHPVSLLEKTYGGSSAHFNAHVLAYDIEIYPCKKVYTAEIQKHSAGSVRQTFDYFTHAVNHIAFQRTVEHILLGNGYPAHAVKGIHFSRREDNTAETALSTGEYLMCFGYQHTCMDYVPYTPCRWIVFKSACEEITAGRIAQPYHGWTVKLCFSEHITHLRK